VVSRDRVLPFGIGSWTAVQPVLPAVSAYPIDEGFRPGRRLALLSRLGLLAQVLTARRGEAGPCGVPPLCAPEDLPALRERELRCACAALGVKAPPPLECQDGQPAQAEPEALEAQITGVARAMILQTPTASQRYRLLRGRVARAGSPMSGGPG